MPDLTPLSFHHSGLGRPRQVLPRLDPDAGRDDFGPTISWQIHLHYPAIQSFIWGFVATRPQTLEGDVGLDQ